MKVLVSKGQIEQKPFQKMDLEKKRLILETLEGGKCESTKEPPKNRPTIYLTVISS